MATKKGIYFADDQAEFLGDITSKRVATAIDRYREILRRDSPRNGKTWQKPH